MRVSDSYDRPIVSLRPTRARRIIGMSLSAVPHVSISARRSSIDTSGRSRNKTTWAINGAAFWETCLQVDNGDRRVHELEGLGAVPLVPPHAVELVPDPRWVWARGLDHEVAAASAPPRCPDHVSRACVGAPSHSSASSPLSVWARGLGHEVAA